MTSVTLKVWELSALELLGFRWLALAEITGSNAVFLIKRRMSVDFGEKIITLLGFRSPISVFPT
jgi:hypothetical protein